MSSTYKSTRPGPRLTQPPVPGSSFAVTTEGVAAVAGDVAGTPAEQDHLRQLRRAEASLNSVVKLLQSNRELACDTLDTIMCQVDQIRRKLRKLGSTGTPLPHD